MYVFPRSLVMCFSLIFKSYADVLAIIYAAWWFLLLLLVPETRHDRLLFVRANRRRRETGDDRYRVQAEFSISSLFRVSLARPFIFLGTEVIIMFGAAYNGLTFAILFLFNSVRSLLLYVRTGSPRTE